ncbi:MAG TPA: hypothetical protein ENN19_11880, partial [Chloroflexi bacterium]|nr:hypothetical protein [Chloroflexota bacterium]
MRSNAWRFDLTSALIGAIITLLLLGLAYYFRDQLRAGWQSAKAPFHQISRYFQADAAERYLEQIITYTQSLSTPAFISLETTYIEPQL